MADFWKEFEGVRAQVVRGNAHLELWKNLSKRLLGDPNRLALNTGPTFFGMTLEAHLNSAILFAARIFDTHRGVLNLDLIRKYADAHKGSLSAEASHELEEALRKAYVEIPKLEAALNAVRTRRNKTLAHLDPIAVSDPVELMKKSEITVQDLQKIFLIAWEILNGVSGPYWRITGSLKLMDIDDFETPLGLIESGKKRQIEEIRAEFPDLQGIPPA